MPTSTRFLIGQPAGALPEQLFLHVFDGGEDAAEMDWSAARVGALQFGSHESAARFAATHRLGAVEISRHPSDDLVGPTHRVSDRANAVA